MKELSLLSGHQTSNKLKHYPANDLSVEILSNSIMYYLTVKQKRNAWLPSPPTENLIVGVCDL